MKKPIVSIIIPTYNEENNIERLLKSINSQTYRLIESIVVDDGSSDSTVLISEKYASRVFAREHAERSIQRNFGASRAKGKYVVFLDADMELTKRVIESCVANIGKHKALIIPEKTVGKSFMAKIRSFEREMYEGDRSIEVARFFDKKVFNEFNGYDVDLTGTEDYDLPYRISKEYSLGRINDMIYHHEQQLTLFKQLKKKYYYAKNSAYYAEKHPDLIAKQGILILRKAYLRNWRKFVGHPFLGGCFIVVRLAETVAAILGYFSAVGLIKSVKTFLIMVKNK